METKEKIDYAIEYYAALGEKGIIFSGLMLAMVTNVYADALQQLHDIAKTKKEKISLKIEVATELSECAEDFCRAIKKAMELKDEEAENKEKAWKEEYDKWLNNT